MFHVKHLPNNLGVEVIKMKLALALVTNVSAALWLISYVGLVWYSRQEREIPGWVVVLFFLGAGGILLCSILIYALHYAFKCI
jgi:hypothetical protein